MHQCHFIFGGGGSAFVSPFQYTDNAYLVSYSKHRYVFPKNVTYWRDSNRGGCDVHCATPTGLDVFLFFFCMFDAGSTENIIANWAVISAQTVSEKVLNLSLSRETRTVMT
jgi:hypothetical protein